MGKLRDLELIGIGAAATVRDKVKNVGKKLFKKGADNEKEFMKGKGKIVKDAKAASKEALAISKKSLLMLEKELKKLEVEAKKAEKALKAKVKKKRL
jgi:polyhydroxyalkanoate synthesis regulator phasin